MKKADAIAEVKARGYTHHFDTGESGDCGYGSRLYFRRPGLQVTPTINTATVSQVPGAGWLSSYFGEEK